LTVLAPVATLGTISDAGLVMGARAWFFLRSRPGELRPLARSVVDDFFFRAGRLPADAEGFVRYANALVHTAWRNGPVENVHAGGYHGYPVDQRRVTPAAERELMAFVSERLALGMTVCLQLAMERPQRSWSEQVLPYGLAEILRIRPSRWTLTETTREVRLPA
jgi:hypothetical protein